MLKRTALIALAAAVIGYAAMPQTAEAAGYKSSRSSSFSSSRSSSYSRPKAIAPARSATPYSRPSVPRGAQAAQNQRPTTSYRQPVKSATPYGRNTSYRAPARKVSSPMSRPSYAPRSNYSSRSSYGNSGYSRGHYGGNSYGRGYGGGYGGGMMGGGGPGLGSMLLAGAGGAIIGNMLYNNFSHTPSANTTRTTDTVTPVQADEIRQEQRIEDKLDQVNDKLDAFPAGPQGYALPADAPLMMSPSFYQLGSGQ